jgi:uncharacterized membrane protein
VSSDPIAVAIVEDRSARRGLLAWALANPLLLVWTAVVGWTIGLVAIVRSHYENFWLARFDLGNMVQAVWSTAHGHPLEVTDLGGEQTVRLAGHVDPFLVLLTPFWLLFPSPLTLGALQITAVALGALPVFWLGRRHLESDRAAALLALAYLAYPWLCWTALDAMHPVTFAIPLFLYAIWFLDSGRTWAFALCAALVLSTGELMGVPLAALGIWFWLSRGQRRAGFAILAGGFAWTALALEVVSPAFRNGSNVFYGYYASIGGSPGGVAKTAATDPGAIVSAIFSGRDVLYVFLLAAPLLGAFVLAPGLAAVALPQLLANGLSDWPFTTDVHNHYLAAIIPFLIAATVLGIAKRPRESRERAAGVVLGLCVALSLLLGPWPRLPGERNQRRDLSYSAAHLEAMRAAADLVPDGAPVSATNRFGSVLSARRYVYSPPRIRRATWVVVDTHDAWVAGTPWQSATGTLGWDEGVMQRVVARLKQSDDWRTDFERDGVLVFERKTGS